MSTGFIGEMSQIKVFIAELTLAIVGTGMFIPQVAQSEPVNQILGTSPAKPLGWDIGQTANAEMRGQAARSQVDIDAELADIARTKRLVKALAGGEPASQSEAAKPAFGDVGRRPDAALEARAGVGNTLAGQSQDLMREMAKSQAVDAARGGVSGTGSMTSSQAEPKSGASDVKGNAASNRGEPSERVTAGFDGGNSASGTPGRNYSKQDIEVFHLSLLAWLDDVIPWALGLAVLLSMAFAFKLWLSRGVASSNPAGARRSSRRSGSSRRSRSSQRHEHLNGSAAFDARGRTPQEETGFVKRVRAES